MQEKTDAETKRLLNLQADAQDLVGHRAWGWARQKLVDKIMELQNAFNIADGDANKMLIDLHSRKLATDVLYSWLREVEGTASQSFDNKPEKESYIVKLE